MKRIGIIVCLLGMSVGWVHAQLQPFRVGILLPFQTEITKRDKSMDRFADFYTGALIAVYEMQATGQPVEIYTYDVGKSAHQLERVLDNNHLDSLDMIIGPVYPAQVRIMAEWTEQYHVLTLLPFVYEVPELQYNPYLLQFNPSEAADAELIVNDLETRSDSVQMIFVEAEGSVVPTGVREILGCVRNSGLKYVYTSVQQIMADSLWVVMSDSAENILVMNTERYANVRQVMPYLERAAQGRQLTLLTRYAWQDEPIILSQIYTTVFRKNVDVDAQGVTYGQLYRRFVKEERTLSRPCYDLLGYDLMTFALQTLQLQHELPQENAIERIFEGLQSDMHFIRVSPEGGYQNSNIHIVRVR